MPEQFGFRSGARGAHASRTIMLADLSAVLDAVPVDAMKADYRKAIIDNNVGAKATAATRLESYERLSQLYSLDRHVLLFRALRRIWDLDRGARPLLALLCAVARDPILRATIPTILDLPEGQAIASSAFRAQVALLMPDRFNEGSLRRIAGNIASSWTQSGHLTGRHKKVRTSPLCTPGAAMYAILLGYLTGVRGKTLLTTPWARLASTNQPTLLEAASSAARRGWFDFKRSGEICEVRFPGLLTSAEEEASREPD